MLKKEATRPPGFNSLQQQARFDAFLREFNAERPHEALDMKCPAEIYTASARAYAGLPELTYPFHDRDVIVTTCGRLCLHRKKINISVVLAGQKLGIKEVDDGIWLVSFMHYDLDTSTWSRKPCNPSTTRSARGCHPCLRYVLSPVCPVWTRSGQWESGAARGTRTPDPVITNDVLYQLSYCGEPCRARAMPAPIRALLISGMA